MSDKKINYIGGGVTHGLTTGTALAMIISWSLHHSILWALLHGILSWLYVIYFAVNR